MEDPHRLRAEPGHRRAAPGTLTGWFARHHGSVHLLALVLVSGCGAATWWQVNRALGGNGLSWAYVFEWPFFAGYAVFMWRRLLREASGRPQWRVSPDSWLAVPPPTAAEEHAEAERLWDYNRYLAELAVVDQARQLARRRSVGPGGRAQIPGGEQVRRAGPSEVEA